MKKFILLNLAVIAMMSSAHADVPGYRKIPKADVPDYLSAIEIALENAKNNGGSRVNPYYNMLCGETLKSNYTELYIDSNLQQPLIIAEYSGRENTFRVTIQTDSSLKSILSMRYSQFSLENVKTNDGTLAEPKITVTPTWKMSLDDSCLYTK